MKNFLLTLIISSFCFLNNANANDNTSPLKNNNFTSALHVNYLDPGHKQKRGAQLGKDRSPFEVYVGSHPSIALKLNFFSSKHGTLTERGYVMMGMDFDTDLSTKFGFVLNPGKKNKNRSLLNPTLGFHKLWRYVMVRQAIELGFKGQFLDSEEDELINKNYSGITANYSLIFDGNFIFDKTAWYFFDHRTARRIRIKLDAGLFFNFDQFNQPSIGFASSSNNSNGFDFSDEITDLNGNLIKAKTYPVLSPFFNISLGFAF
tara:strand:- start:28365 stop:29147 length:783 start_codon:yes stop_codon:yes gene_type:complete